MPKVFISKFSSLNFSKGWQHDFEQQECYVQPFAKGDIIRVQLKTDLSLSYLVKNLETDEITTLTPTISDVNEVLLPDLEIGVYRFDIELENNVFASSVFSIVDKECLTNTVLFRYTNTDNDFNTDFGTDEAKKFFDYRVEGGFLNKDKSFNVEDSDFRDQDYSLRMLEAWPYTTHPLTIGEANGVPIWVGEKINLIMSLTNVLIDNEPYVRSSGSAPDLVEIKSYYPLYVFKIDLERENTFGDEYNVKWRVLGTEDDKLLATEDDKGIKV